MMEIELWWLAILPVLFVLGWWAARYDARQWGHHTRDLPRSYFKGVNFLLNEQPDRAIDAFVEVAQVDPETIELHYALGSLFRRRGETDRAIRVHQSLLGRRDLSTHDREHALYELALDYFKAGLLDRAEMALTKIQEAGFRAQADHLLISIFEMAKDWTAAIQVAERLQSETSQPLARELAFYHCEIAEAKLRAGHDAAAAEALQSALQWDAGNLRALILEGRRLAQLGQLEAALTTWHRITTIAPSFLALIAQDLANLSLQSSGGGLAFQRLTMYHREFPSVDLLRALAWVLQRREGDQAAETLIRSALKQSPSMLVLGDLLALTIKHAEGERLEELTMMARLVENQSKRLSRYVCTGCGFKARTYYWRCPGCNAWHSYSPKRHEELEAGG